MHENREDRATRERRLAGSGECRDGWHHEGNFARDGDANPASQQLQRIDAGRSRSGEAVVRHRPRLHHPAVSETRTARRHHRAFHHASAFGPYRWPAGPVAQRLGRDALGFANLADGLFGPKGTVAMTENLTKAFSEDIRIREDDEHLPRKALPSTPGISRPAWFTT